MSGYRGGRRRNRGEDHTQYNKSVTDLEPDDYDNHERRRDVFYESPEQKLRSTIFKFGEVVRPQYTLDHCQTTD